MTIGDVTVSIAIEYKLNTFVKAKHTVYILKRFAKSEDLRKYKKYEIEC